MKKNRGVLLLFFHNSNFEPFWNLDRQVKNKAVLPFVSLSPRYSITKFENSDHFKRKQKPAKFSILQFDSTVSCTKWSFLKFLKSRRNWILIQEIFSACLSGGGQVDLIGDKIRVDNLITQNLCEHSSMRQNYSFYHTDMKDWVEVVLLPIFSIDSLEYLQPLIL